MLKCFERKPLQTRLFLVHCAAAVRTLFVRSVKILSLLHRWSYGANRVQVDADIKVLSEFLSYLQSDSVRGPPAISSLSIARLNSACESLDLSQLVTQLIGIFIDYAERMRSLNLPLRLLTENEIFRMSVWGNPINDARKGGDLIGGTERTLLEVTIIFRHTFPSFRTENTDILANSHSESLGTRPSNCGVLARTVQKRHYPARGV